jgi:2-methylcitrate dehydratase PrpD
MTVAQGIAHYIVQTGYSDIPGSVIDRAKECILDSIGVALYGSRFQASAIALDVVGDSGQQKRGASVFGRRARIFPPLAAFVNGIMAHVADFDDILAVLRGHPSCVLMPAALATCETAGGNGKDLLTAFVVGSEVGGKLGSVIAWELSKAGWHVTGTIGSVAAAAAASKALRLDPDKVSNALGIAASGAAGLRVNFGTMTKSYHAGHAAMVGVLSAQLAEKGFDSSATALEGEQGFARLFGYSGDLSSVVGVLGNDYALTGIMLKPYPSCGGTHTAIDAIHKIRDQIKPNLEDIAEIEAWVPPSLLRIAFHHNPQTPLEAKFSLEFCVSAALVFGEVGIGQFEDKCILDPRVRDLMERVRMIPDAEMEKASQERGVLSPVRLKMKLRNGEEFSETVWEARGGPSNPMSLDEIRGKFRECAGQVLPDPDAERALATIERLEALKKVSDLTSILAGRRVSTKKDKT